MRPLAMVVGGSRRVGRGVALELARSGFDLIVTYHTDIRGARETESMAIALGAKVDLHKMDLNHSNIALDDVRGLGLEKLDALIVSAAVWEKDCNAGADMDQAERCMRINARTPIELARTLAPALNQSSLQGGACVIAFGDIHVDFRPLKDFKNYLASKRALHSGFQALALELAPKIRVNVIVAGVIDWPESMPQVERDAYVARVPLGRVGTPHDAAALVRFLTLEAPFITGAAIPLDGGRSLGNEVG